MGSSRGRFGVKVGGQGLGRGQGLGVKVGVKVSGQGQGHDWWTQRLVSRSGVKVVGSRSGNGQGHGEGVNVWRIGVRWSMGEVEDKQSVSFKNS